MKITLTDNEIKLLKDLKDQAQAVSTAFIGIHKLLCSDDYKQIINILNKTPWDDDINNIINILDVISTVNVEIDELRITTLNIYDELDDSSFTIEIKEQDE